MATYKTINEQYAKFLNSALAQGSIELRDKGFEREGGTMTFIMMVDYAEIDWEGSVFSVLNNRENHPMVGVHWGLPHF